MTVCYSYCVSMRETKGFDKHEWNGGGLLWSMMAVRVVWKQRNYGEQVKQTTTTTFPAENI